MRQRARIATLAQTVRIYSVLDALVELAHDHTRQSDARARIYMGGGSAVARFVVHENAVAGPSTHAVVIAVGCYPHLLGGVPPVCDDNEGLGQLTSPPVSGRAFADWLIQHFNNPGKPLATVALLISEELNAIRGETSRYLHPSTGASIELERASIENIATAVAEWKIRGDANDQNMTLFYFCGHGIAQGSDAALLAEDYGANNQNALDGAIDFRRLHLGMNGCSASQQCYFVDACRATSDMLLENRDYLGRPLVQIRKDARRNKPLRQAPVFYASLAGALAYARPKRPSVFTEALLKSFNGAGSDDEDGDWRVSTSRLLDALDNWGSIESADSLPATTQDSGRGLL